MTALNREAADLGEFSDEAHNDNGEATDPGRTVTGVSPGSVETGSTVTVTVSGTDFEDGTGVLIDGAPVDTAYVSATALTVSVAPTSAGSATVTADGATGSATLTYADPVAPPEVDE